LVPGSWFRVQASKVRGSRKDFNRSILNCELGTLCPEPGTQKPGTLNAVSRTHNGETTSGETASAGFLVNVEILDNQFHPTPLWKEIYRPFGLRILD
jgi:hypothetical protein